MPMTDQEQFAARQLGEALLRFIHAMEDGIVQRHQARRRADKAAQPSPPERRATSLLPQPVEPARPSKPTKSQPLLVTTREAGRMLGISDRTLWAMTAPRGPIPVVRLGKSVRYDVDDLKATINRLKSKRR